MVTHTEDLALVSRIVSGDENAADEFGRYYMERFIHLARRAGIPSQDCRDVAQEALVTAISQMQRVLFRGESSLGTWLEKIIRGKIAEYWRKRSNRGGSASLKSDNRGDEFAEIEDKHKELIWPALDEETILGVHKALRLMPVRYRVLLLLKHNVGYTIDEISREMDLTMGQVSRRLYTAEDMFRGIYCDGIVGHKMLMAGRSKKEGGQ